MAGMLCLEYIIKGVKRIAQNAGTLSRLPVTPEIFRAIKRVWQNDPDHSKTSMLWAAVCKCFFGSLRSGKVVVSADAGYDSSTHLLFGDVHLNNVTDAQFSEITIKASKTDPFRQVVKVYLGRTNTDLCPVAAVLNYMTAGVQTEARYSGIQQIKHL